MHGGHIVAVMGDESSSHWAVHAKHSAIICLIYTFDEYNQRQELSLIRTDEARHSIRWSFAPHFMLLAQQKQHKLNFE